MYTTAAGSLPLPPASMGAGLRFLQLCLHTSAGVAGVGVAGVGVGTRQTLQLLARYLKESGMNTGMLLIYSEVT